MFKLVHLVYQASVELVEQALGICMERSSVSFVRVNKASITVAENQRYHCCCHVPNWFTVNMTVLECCPEICAFTR